jgi:hypothetical protein
LLYRVKKTPALLKDAAVYTVPHVICYLDVTPYTLPQIGYLDTALYTVSQITCFQWIPVFIGVYLGTFLLKRVRFCDPVAGKFPTINSFSVELSRFRV